MTALTLVTKHTRTNTHTYKDSSDSSQMDLLLKNVQFLFLSYVVFFFINAMHAAK